MQNTSEQQLAADAIPEAQTPAHETSSASEQANSAGVAQQPDVGRGLTNAIFYTPDADGNLVEADAQETQTQEPPADPIAGEVIRALQDAMKAAEIADVDSWLSSLDNAIFTPGISEGQCIFLINRALRLLLLERRDANEKDRNAALMGIVDVTKTDQWLKALSSLTLPHFKKYDIGRAGIRFKEGEEPAWFKTAKAAETAPVQEPVIDDASPCSTEPV